MTTAAVPPQPPRYPVHLDANTEPVASRWLWLVKWLLAIPHFIVLAFLWVAFAVLSVVAFFAILFTGRYPRAIFDFNVGVLRWSWRVAYYAYGALATDRYPPFTLSEVEDYPTHLEIDYPEHLSRGLVLIKWWLLAIPHYLVVGILVGGGTWVVQDDQWRYVDSTGLVGLLAFIAAVVLLVTGSYPRPIYDLLLGLNRWVLRVAAYVALMTDQYPPFRLDMGPHEPDHALVMRSAEPVQPPPPAQFSGPAPVPAPLAGQGPVMGTGPVTEPGTGPFPAPGTGPISPGPAPRSGWTPGRTITVVVGILMGLFALGGVASGGALIVADRALRDDGFVTTPAETWRSGGYAVVLGDLLLEAPGADQSLPGLFFGDVRVQVTPTSAEVPVFVGIAPEADVEAYLSEVARTVPGEEGPGPQGAQDIAGGSPAVPPTELDIWVAQASGFGTQSATWSPRDGSWAAVVMNADGSRGVSGAVEFGARLPWLGAAGVAMFTIGLLFLAGGVTLVAVGIARASKRNT
jgi:hypothetical protein